MARKEGEKDKKTTSRSKLGVAAGSGVQSSGAKTSAGKEGKLSKGQRKKAAQERRKAAKPPKQTFWAVQVGRVPGVYTELEKYEEQVKGFPGAKAKKFKTQRLADAFVANADKVSKKEKKRKKAEAAIAAGGAQALAAKSTKVEYWGVRVGRIPGVYTSLERAQEQVHGFSGAEYKKFKLEHEAQAFAGVTSEPVLLVRPASQRLYTACVPCACKPPQGLTCSAPTADIPAGGSACTAILSSGSAAAERRGRRGVSGVFSRQV